MLSGRLGLETARLPHADRHGLISLDRGHLTVEDGCLTFACAGGGTTPAGRYGLPHQSVSLVLLGPGSTVSHDALRLLARHGVDVADLVRDSVTIPCAFKAAALAERRPAEQLERLTRRMTGERLRRDGVIPRLIDRIKTILAEPTADELAIPGRRPVRSAGGSEPSDGGPGNDIAGQGV